MDTIKSKPLETVSLTTSLFGILALCFTLFYGGAGVGVFLLCVCVAVLGHYLIDFDVRGLFNPYTLMVTAPLMLLKYSSMVDFRIRLFSFVILIYIVISALYGFKPGFKFSLKDAKPWLIFFVAFGIFAMASVVIYVQGVHLSGDEPHYLMITQSLAEDGDFDLKNNFHEKSYFDYLPIDLRFHGGEYKGQYLSFHLPGVSFLLLPFFFLFKLVSGFVPAALYFRLIASVLNGFFGLCLFYILKRSFPDREITGFWIFMLSVFPLVFHGAHLYPELPAATLIMAAYLFVMSKKRNFLVAGLFLSLVPWFHIKYIPSVLVLTAAIIYMILERLRPLEISREKIREILRFFMFPVISLLVLVIYCKVLYGSYSPTDIFPKESYWSVPWLLRLKVFLAYFLDQRDGLLFYSPLFLLVFVSFRNKWRDKYLLIAIGFAYIFFHAFTTVRGAYSPAGRPLMFIVWILILFIAQYYFTTGSSNQKFLGVQNPSFKKGFGRRRHHAARGPIMFRFLAGLNIFFLCWLFYYPLFVYQPVFSGTVERASGLNLFLGSNFIELWRLFPSFLTSPRAAHLANYVWLGVLVLVVCIYYLRKKPVTFEGRGVVLTGVVLFLVLGFLYCFYPHVYLIKGNKHKDRIVSFFNNSRNFHYLAERKGFRIKSGNLYDIYIDRDMILKDELTFHFTYTDVNGIVMRNGKRLLFESERKMNTSYSLRLSALDQLDVKGKPVSHLGFETVNLSDKDSFIWLEIK